MSQVEITGWIKGCDTVAAIKELREKASMPLNEAHALINRVLENEHVIVRVPNSTDAQQFVDSLRRLGLAAVHLGAGSVEAAAGR